MMPIRSNIPKSDLPTVLLHWGLVITLTLSLATGMRIAADMPDASWASAISGFLPQGNVILWHMWGAWALTGCSVAYLVFMMRAGLMNRIALDRTWLNALRSATDRHSWWRAVNIAVFWFAFLAVLAASLSGLLLDLLPGLLPFAAVSTVHQFLAWSIVFYVAIHVLALVAMGGMSYLLKIFRPNPAYGTAAGVALMAGGAAAAALYGLDRTAGDQLLVRRISELPKLDGHAGDAVWQTLNKVEISTMRGVNSPGGEVPVSLRAGHDGEFFYGLFQWPDTTRSQKHLPLVKTAMGWKVTQTEYGIQDEDSYYEDKFGVMLATGSGIAGDGTIHLGNKPIGNKPGPSGGRGLHYTTDGGIVDVWHWKSVRSGNTLMNQIDDNYFGPPLEPKTKGRYTGGYAKDPKSGGGFSMNWESYDDEIIIPKRLPKYPALLEPFQSVDLDPNTSDNTAIFMSMSDTIEYDPALDTYPIGTIMPAVLVEAPFAGDRGDVAAYTRWADGMWTMEVKRKLDTGSEFDVSIKTDQPTYLWVAVFDHAQTRHSQHLHPVTIELE